MSATAASGAPGSGSVHRVSGNLLVELPADMPGSTRRTLENQLLQHAEAVVDDTGVLTVPVPHAHKLTEVLSRPWPARRWDWDWSTAALASSTNAEQVHQAVQRLLHADPPGPAEVAQLVDRLRAGGFTRTLLPAQEGAVAVLVRAEGGGNFSVPGAGKTTMTFASYVALREMGVVDRMLVVAPQSAYEAWLEESQDCFEPTHRPSIELAPRSPRRATQVVVINYERAAQGSMRAAIDSWSRGRRLLVVFDEAHRAKRGPKGEHGRGALDLSELATRRMVLTGTPMPNGPDDLGATLELAWPGHGPMLASRNTPGAERAWVRITKDQLDLEPATVVVHDVPLDENHQRIYDALAQGLADDAEALAARPELATAAIARLIAAASNPTVLSREVSDELTWSGDLPAPDASVLDLINSVSAAVRPAKLLAAAALAKAHAARGEKLLVWTNFLSNVRELHRLLAPYNPAVITGSLVRDDPTAATDRVRQLTTFREDTTCTVLIATPQTLGEGVSLHHACQSQVHVDRTFNAGLYLQAIDRTHRVGMPPGTTARVTLLVARGTIDEAIQATLDRKLVEMEERLRDPTLRRLAEPDRTGYGVGPEEVAALLAHLR